MKKTHIYVHNADNSTRRLMIHSDKDISNGIVIDGKSLEEMKNLCVRSSKPKKTNIPLRTRKEFPKVVDKTKTDQLFYNGVSTNFVPLSDINCKEEWDKQVERKSAFTKAMQNEDRRFAEMIQKDRNLYFANLKCIAKEKQRKNQKNQEYLVKKIKENEQKRNQELSRRRLVPVEKYIFARKKSAQRIEDDLNKCIREEIEIRRKEHDLNAINRVQGELKMYEEKENKKLSDINEQTGKK